MHILELSLQTNQLAETIHFYSQVLGLPLVQQTEQSATWRIGSSLLIFEQTDAVQQPHYHFTFNIPCNQLAASIAWLTPKAAPMETDEGMVVNFENWKAQSVYFYDNNRNILELIARTDLQNPSDAPFTVTSLLHISEAGVVADAPLELGEQIEARSGIPFFTKGPRRADFAAVGEETGLFVISNPHRNWFPTQDRAEKHRVRVLVEMRGERFEWRFNENSVYDV